MIVRYLPLARRLAMRYGRGAEPLEDLVQVASLGLVKAVDRWDPTRGVPFPAFAMPTILGELRRHFRDHTWVVRPPREMHDLLLAIWRARERLQCPHGREPSVAELAEHLGRSPQDVAEALEIGRMRAAASLDADETSGDRQAGA